MIDKLKRLGADIDDAMRRFQGNEALYKRLLIKFPEQVVNLNASVYFENEDYDKALENVHTLKGLAANLSLANLYEAYSEVVDLLRTERYIEAEQRYFALLALEKQYNKVILEG